MHQDKAPFRVLHIASFAGNVGDNISHLGLRRLIGAVVGSNYVEEPLEIRRTYINYGLSDKLLLDETFAELCNRFDLVVFGGGNILEPFPDTPSGTRLSFDRRALASVSVPMLFASVGMVARSPLDADPRTAKRHRATVDFLSGHPKLEVILRNDGSPRWLEQHYPSIAGSFQNGLDAGFFAVTDRANRRSVHLAADMPIALNLSLDQMESALAPGWTYDMMLRQIAEIVSDRLESSEDTFEFIPHVHHDLRVFSDLMEKIPDFYARSRISVSSLQVGKKGGMETIRAYEKVKESWSMRFHSNISAIVAEKPLLPFVAMNRLDSLLDSVGFIGERVDLTGRLVRANPVGASATVVSAHGLQQIIESTQKVYRQSLARIGVA